MDWFLYDNGLRHERVKGYFVDDIITLCRCFTFSLDLYYLVCVLVL